MSSHVAMKNTPSGHVTLLTDELSVPKQLQNAYYVTVRRLIGHRSDRTQITRFWLRSVAGLRPAKRQRLSESRGESRGEAPSRTAFKPWVFCRTGAMMPVAPRSRSAVNRPGFGPGGRRFESCLRVGWAGRHASPPRPPRCGQTSRRPPTPGIIPLTVPKPGGCSPTRPRPAAPGTGWTGGAGHQARSRWYHQRIRLARRVEIALVR
jgi:hypothetical protein